MLSLSSRISTQFRLHAWAEIANAHANALKGIAAVPLGQHEPWHVAWLCAAMGPIAGHWRGLLQSFAPAMNLSLAAVFTHQSPQVAWPTRTASQPNRCELSDVAIVVIDRTKSKPYGRAILVQAKQKASTVVHLSKKERRQHDLYSLRPVFDLWNVGSPSQLNLGGYFPDRALMYGLVSKVPIVYRPFGWPWLASYGLGSRQGRYSVSAIADLAEVMVEVLEGQCGWPFALTASGPDWRHFNAQTPRHDWTVLINYILEETFSKALTKRLATAAGRPIRGQDVPMFYAKRSSAGLQFLTTLGTVSSIARDGAEEGPADTEETDEWQAAELAAVLGDGGGFGGAGDDEGGPRGEGPLSVVVFEIGNEG